MNTLLSVRPAKVRDVKVPVSGVNIVTAPIGTPQAPMQPTVVNIGVNESP